VLGECLLVEKQSAVQKILIVDDEPGTAEMFALMLEGAGYATAAVHGTRTAIEAIEQQRPDLVLLDIMMPGLSGLEFCRYVRRDPRFLELPIVVVSARGQPEDIAVALEAGASIYLKKPVSKVALFEGITRGFKVGTATTDTVPPA
jgi:CheY-like chemotaxis protein